MNALLRKIIRYTKQDIKLAKDRCSIDGLLDLIKDAPIPRPFLQDLDKESIDNNFAIIAEIKNSSPSLGRLINSNVESIIKVYEEQPIIKAISVVTNQTHFHGSVQQMKEIRSNVSKPVLMKNFIVNSYQIYEARAYHADAVLLIASILSENQLRNYYKLVQELGMEALFEIHSITEFKRLPDNAKIIGINSRKRFGQINLESFDLVSQIPSNKIRIAESGITPSCFLRIRKRFDGVLIGTSILKNPTGYLSAVRDFDIKFNIKRG